MRYNKKAQGEVITTVLIILLVLAAIVIVWQVVNSTIKKGAGQITSQSGCIGIDIEVVQKPGNTDGKVFVAKRSAQGGSFTASDVLIIVDELKLDPTTDADATIDDTQSPYTLNPVANPLKDPLDTVEITLYNAATSSVEVALKGDGTTCPGTGKLTL